MHYRNECVCGIVISQCRCPSKNKTTDITGPCRHKKEPVVQVKQDVVVDDGTWDGENVPTVYVDFLGQEIRVGDFIIYATSRNSTASVTVGRVLEFRTKDADGAPYGFNGFDYSVEVPKGEQRPRIFTPYWKFYVQPVANGNSSRGGGIHNARNVIIGTIHNVHKVDVSNATFAIPDPA